MRHSCLFICVVLFLNLGCKGQGKSPIQGLNDRDYSVAKAVNDAHQTTLNAAQTAFGVSHMSTAIDSKVATTADAIRQANCGQSRQEPIERYNQSWQGLWEVSSATCPIFLHHSSSFNLATSQWSMNHVVAVKTERLQKQNGLISVTAIGDLRVEKFGSSQTLSGNIGYNQFQLTDLGGVKAQIVVSQMSVGSHGKGSANLSLQASDMSLNASVEWGDTDASAVFKVNNQETDRNAFSEAFSSFGLIEIMDRALNMR